MEFGSCINYLLTAAQHEVYQQISERLAEFELTPGQYGVLNYLWEHGKATPKELAQTLMVENSTISGVLDRMQKKGLIDRLIDPDDRRSVRVVLTPEGQALQTGVVKTVDELNAVVLDKLSTEKRDVLLDCLREIGNVK